VAARAAEKTGSVTVRAGDTAGRIASANKPSSVSLEQMLVAMLRGNPQAFIDGNINRITGAQGRVLGSLVANAKLQRMVEYEALATNKATVYTLGEMLTDLRRGLWKEIYAGAPIDAYRRRLQATYLEAMASKIKPPAPNPQEAALAAAFGQALVNTRDFRPLLKDEMRTLDRELAAAVARTSDRTSRAHLMDARDQIKAMLDTDK
jgi:FimV-like protein